MADELTKKIEPIQKGGRSSPLSMPRAEVERALTKLGLSEKEAQVYLAALELGPSPVQEFAKQSGVNRATTYVMVESLIERGLMSSVERNGKRVYSAEPPDRLSDLLRQEEERIRNGRRSLDRILPELGVLLQAAPERPCVRFYEGVEGLDTMRQDFFSGDEAHDLLLISSADDYHRLAGLSRRLPHAKKIEIKRGRECCIFTSGRLPAELKRALPSVGNVERYRVPQTDFPLAGEIAIYGSKIAMLSYHGKIMGVLIDSPHLAQTAVSLFKLAWETAKKYERFD